MSRSFCIAFFLLSAVFALPPGAPVHARTWYIRPDGSGDAPTIQAGIDSAAASDTVLVAPGVFAGCLNLSARPGLCLRSESGAQETIIEGGQSGSVVTMASGAVTGFTIRNGLAGGGGGIYVMPSGTVLLRANIIEQNIAGIDFDSGLGGGVFVGPGFGTVLIDSNILRDNIAGSDGGGIFVYARISTTDISNNLIVANRSKNLGGGIAAGDASVVGNLIGGNYSDYNGAGVSVVGGVLRNNTILGNTVGLPSGAANTGSGSLISRNIIAWNTAGFPGGRALGLSCADCTIECNDLWGNDDNAVGGFGNTLRDNFSVDPEFCAVDPVSSLNFFLQRDSPCLSRDTCDLVGANRDGCGVVSVNPATWSEVKRFYR